MKRLKNSRNASGPCSKPYSRLTYKTDEFRRVGLQVTKAHNQSAPCIELQRSLPSEVSAISPFVDGLMLLLSECGCVAEGESGVEIALREALANAIIHGNYENPGKHVHVRCRCEPSEISIAVKDEGEGFDVTKIADPTAPENTGSVHGRGIYLMKALMDEVRFEEGGVAVHMRKSTGKAGAHDVKNLLE
jgi:serine/threonine-protein kinase RsbW